MSPSATKVDRASRVRRALVELVAENGFRGTSMAAVADRADVATGTAYVHYGSKDELVLAAYAEIKQDLTRSASTATGTGTDLFKGMWRKMYDHLADDPVRAQFLIQVESSPYAAAAHAKALDELGIEEDAQFAALQKDLVDLPPLVLWDLGMGPAIRAVAFGTELKAAELEELGAACWRAVSGSG